MLKRKVADANRELTRFTNFSGNRSGTRKGFPGGIIALTGQVFFGGGKLGLVGIQCVIEYVFLRFFG